MPIKLIPNKEAFLSLITHRPLGNGDGAAPVGNLDSCVLLNL